MNDNLRFVQLSRYIINPNLITSIDLDAGGSTVRLVGGDAVRLDQRDTNLLRGEINPVG